MASSSLGDQKRPETSAGRAIWQILDRRQKKFLLAHENTSTFKGLPRKWKQIRHVEKVYSVKTKLIALYVLALGSVVRRPISA